MSKVVIGVVVDEDTRVVTRSNESYSMIGFVILDLIDLSLSFLDKNVSMDKISSVSNSMRHKIVKLKKHDKFCIEKKSSGVEYSFYHLERGVIMREIRDISDIPPIFSKKLELMPSLGKSKIYFNLEPNIGGLEYECKKAILSVSFGTAKNIRADSVSVAKLGDLFYSPFDGSYIYGSDMCIAGCNLEDVIVQEGIKHIIFVKANNVYTIVLPKSIDKITMNNTTIRAINTYYISKDAKLSAVCSLIENIFFYSTSISSTELALLRYDLHTLYCNGNYDKFYELCKSDKNRKYLDEILSEVKIIVY